MDDEISPVYKTFFTEKIQGRLIHLVKQICLLRDPTDDTL